MQGGEMRAGGYATPWATVEDCLHAFPACREKLAKLEAAGGTFAKVVEKSPEALTAMEKSVVECAEAVGCASTVGVGQHATVREVVDADGLHWAWKNWREGWDETDKQDRERERRAEEKMAALPCEGVLAAVDFRPRVQGWSGADPGYVMPLVRS